jgi:hypothetical protein
MIQLARAVSLLRHCVCGSPSRFGFLCSCMVLTMKNSFSCLASSGQRSKRVSQTSQVFQPVVSAESLLIAASLLATSVCEVSDSWDRLTISEVRHLHAAMKRIGMLADRYLLLQAAHEAGASSVSPSAQGAIMGQPVTHEFILPNPMGSIGLHLSFGDPLLLQNIDLGLMHAVSPLWPGYVWALLWCPDLAGMHSPNSTAVSMAGVELQFPRDPTLDASNYEAN